MNGNRRSQAGLINHFHSIIGMIDLILLVALGFVPTYGALELAWRMSKQIAKRGEPVIVK